MTVLPVPPAFASFQEFRERLVDVDFWWPYLVEIHDRHDLAEADPDLAAGFNGTYPTFVSGDVVVKFFGYIRSSHKSLEAERAAYVLLSTDPEIAAPRLLASGRLFDDEDNGWPYLVTSRMPGVASWRADLSTEQRISIAAEVGKQIRRVHALSPSGVATDADWPVLNVTAAAARSSLPPHLVARVDDYITQLGPLDRVFINGDLVANHAHVENGRLVGIIDWGDAMETDRHCELIQIYRDLFACDKSLFRVFLEASDWPLDDDFPRKALGHALRRQAIGLVQHPTIDVFEPIADRYPLHDIATLDEFAIELFQV
jgi:hygromycin-B 7''-O-kinase